MELPNQLKADIEAALTIISARCPAASAPVAEFERALKAESPMLAKRFAHLIDVSLGRGHPSDLSPEEQHEIGATLLELEHFSALRRPGPRVRGNEYRLMVYLTEDEEAALKAYCDRKNISRAEAVRRGLALLVK